MFGGNLSDVVSWFKALIRSSFSYNDILGRTWDGQLKNLNISGGYKGGKLGHYPNQVAGSDGEFLECHLVPRMGNKLLIDGRLRTIPAGVLATSGGVRGLYSNCYIDGVAGQALSTNTLYFVYAFMVSGVMALNFSTTGHKDDPDYGIKVKSNDRASTLIGLIYTKTSTLGGGEIVTLGNARAQTLASYYNRLRYSFFGTISNQTFTKGSPDPWVVIDLTKRIEWVQWADDLATGPMGFATCTAASAGETGMLGCLLNGTNISPVATIPTGYSSRAVADVTTANSFHLVAHTYNAGGTDQYNYCDLVGSTVGATNITAVAASIIVENVGV